MTTLAGITRADWGQNLKLSYKEGHLSWAIAATAAFYVAGMATRAFVIRFRAQPLFWLLRPKAEEQSAPWMPTTLEDFAMINALTDPRIDSPEFEAFLKRSGRPVGWRRRGPISFPAADFLAAGGMEEAEIQQVLGEPRQPQPYQVAAIESIESGGSSYNPKPSYPPSDRSGPRQRRPRGFKAS
jgi:hypothetical protein